MRAREKLARAQGALEELRAKPKPLESWTIANLPARLLLTVLAQSWYSPYIKFTSQSIVTCSYNISVPERDCYERLVGSPVTCNRDSWRSKYKQHCWVEYDSTGGVRQLTKCLTCSYCARDLSRENSLKNANINNKNNNNNNRIFGLNIRCIIQVKVSTWPLGVEL